MRRIFVHEFVSGGGLAHADPAMEAGLMPLGMSMRDAMVADLLRLPGVSVTASDCATAPLPPGAARAVRAAPGEAAFDFIARQAREHDLAWIVAPESDGLLAHCQELVGGERWLGCDARAIRVASSKHRTLTALCGAGVATPLDFVDAPEITRWVVKPDDGAGAVATFTYTDLAAARHAAARRRAQDEAVTLEPWVPGEAMSISLLCDGQEAELLSINRQHVALRPDGQVAYEGVSTAGVPGGDLRAAALRDLATQVARALPGLRGFAGVDLVWHAARGPVVIEVNPRVSCAYVGLSERLGRNLAAEMLATHDRHLREAHDAPR